ncbi:MAG: 2,3,4,5-tetrahydropyridine-2,6-dicarboxylate N-succinyltransferase [Oligoflexia bacterium]|nr:2,3,4,5-tetrahydropyridine-2,6-dicarboxylate N-succinyltransferase [Oligoflexia bacterium]
MSEYQKILDDLEIGKIRAIKQNTDGTISANVEVKEAILAAFRSGKNIELTQATEGLYKGFVDKDTILPRKFRESDSVRLVPGGSSVRRGAYVAKGVIIMPPAYINIGAYVDEGTMVDSHVLVGSCAQIGKKVHLSAGVQIGGVLEPIGQTPVVIDDNAFIGAGAIIVEGIHVKKGAVIAPGVVLSKGVSIYDAVNECVLERGAPVPENAVVVPGTRPLKASEWASKQNLFLHCPIIIKYRDEKSNASLVLEEILR